MASGNLNRRMLALAGLASWGAAIYGVLQINGIPGNYVHDLCGAWG